MEQFIFLFIGAIIVFNIFRIVTKANKRSSLRHHSLAAKGAGGAASVYFLNQLIQEHNLDEDMICQLEQMDLQQMQDFALQNQLSSQMELQQMMDQAMDPYQNPGIDMVVDESFHGIDHGMHDHSMQDHSFHDHNHHNF